MAIISNNTLATTGGVYTNSLTGTVSTYAVEYAGSGTNTSTSGNYIYYSPAYTQPLQTGYVEDPRFAELTILKLRLANLEAKFAEFVSSHGTKDNTPVDSPTRKIDIT